MRKSITGGDFAQIYVAVIRRRIAAEIGRRVVEYACRGQDAAIECGGIGGERFQSRSALARERGNVDREVGADRVDRSLADVCRQCGEESVSAVRPARSRKSFQAVVVQVSEDAISFGDEFFFVDAEDIRRFGKRV